MCMFIYLFYVILLTHINEASANTIYTLHPPLKLWEICSDKKKTIYFSNYTLVWLECG